MANTPPSAALDMNIGASKPPDVPDPSEITSASALKTATSNSSLNARLLFRMSEIVSYPTPSTRGTKYPMIPSPSAPIAGCHSSSIGSRVELVLHPIQHFVNPIAAPPHTTPSST